jgi:cytochrome d ubiquinol oxidase subunit II
MWHTWGVFLVLYMLVTMYTLVEIPQAVENFGRFPWAVAAVVLNVLAVANVPRAIYRERYGQAFVSSALIIVALVFLFGMAQYPNLVTASNEPGSSLTIHNAASSEKTLGIGLSFVVIGMPFVLAYTGVVYWTFRGKVRLGDHSY